MIKQDEAVTDRREQQPEADVVIIGSGVAGSLCGYHLAQSGLKVVILEAGPRLDRSELVSRFEAAAVKDTMSAYPKIAHGPDEIIRQGPHTYKFRYVRAVGGTTWHWAAECWRFLPGDFELRSRYGRGRDWPLVMMCSSHTINMLRKSWASLGRMKWI